MRESLKQAQLKVICNLQVHDHFIVLFKILAKRHLFKLLELAFQCHSSPLKGDTHLCFLVSSHGDDDNDDASTIAMDEKKKLDFFDVFVFDSDEEEEGLV